MKISAFFAILLFGSPLWSQRTSSRAELLTSPGGEPMAVLSDSTRLTALPNADNYCKVRQAFLVRAEEVEGETIRSGAGLYSLGRDSVGKLFVDLKAESTVLAGKKFKGYRRFELEAWVHRSRLIASTIPEIEVAEALSEKNKSVQEERLNSLYEREGFEKKETAELVVWVQRMGGADVPEDSPFRIMVVNRNGGATIAVVCNGGYIELPKVKETRSEHGWTIHYLQKPSPAIHEAVVELGLGFMPL